MNEKNINTPAKNIKEYVANAVVKMLREREQEVKEMKRVLEDVDVIKCGFCNFYRKYESSCEFCEIQSCTECDKVYNCASWNLSGCDCCEKCFALYCVWCRKLKVDCYKKGMCA